MQRKLYCFRVREVVVSILTRPGGRVQPSVVTDTLIQPVPVSILTRPGGRVQPDCGSSSWLLTTWFQSSPVPEDGCNNRVVYILQCAVGVSILTRPGGRVQRRTTALNSTQLSSFSAKQRR